MSGAEIQELKNTGMTWTRMADYLGIDRRTLFRWRKNLPQDPQLNDEELYQEILAIKREFPNFGEVYVRAALLLRGFKVKRRRVRDCLSVIHGRERQQRLMPRLLRGPFIVPGVNYLRAIDGNEKLQMFGLYIHGCSDAYSRYNFYLHIADNKKAVVPLKCFYETVLTYGLPRFVRMDRGGENVLIRDFMLANISNSVFIGSSVRNVRIERYWGEVNKVTILHKLLFYQMEHQGILDLNYPIDLFCLHEVYIPRLQNTLNTFRNVWNVHKIRTARHILPRRQNTPDHPIRIVNHITPAEMFEWGEQMPYYPVTQPVEFDNDAAEEQNRQQQNSFVRSVNPDPLAEDGNMGVSLYLALRESILTMLVAPVLDALSNVRSF